MTTLLVAKENGEEDLGVFAANQLEEAKECLHEAYEERNKSNRYIDQSDFYIDELEAGKGNTTVYTYDEEDFLSPLSKHNLEYIRHLISDGFVAADKKMELLKWFEVEDWIIKWQTSTIETMPDGSLNEIEAPKAKKAKTSE